MVNIIVVSHNVCGGNYYFLFRTPVPTITDNEVSIERTGSNS